MCFESEGVLQSGALLSEETKGVRAALAAAVVDGEAEAKRMDGYRIRGFMMVDGDD